MRLSLFLLDVLTTISVRTCSKALVDVHLSKFFIHHDNCYNMRAHFPYIQPVSLSLELLHKRLLSASSNPKLGCLSDLIGYALFVVLSEVCVCVWGCMWEKGRKIGVGRAMVYHRQTHTEMHLIHIPVFICQILIFLWALGVYNISSVCCSGI